MVEVKPFNPKIYLIYPDRRIVFNTLEDYNKHRTTEHQGYYLRLTRKHPEYHCIKCNQYHPKKSNFSPTCTYFGTERDYTTKNKENSSGNLYKTVTITNPAHNIIELPVVKNELGDLIPPKTYSAAQREKDWEATTYNWWINGENSPSLRGLLQIERDKIEAGTTKYGWNYKHRHAIARRNRPGHYRCMHTHNEIKAAIEKRVTPAGVDQSKVVPYLVAKIEQLERRIKNLEGEQYVD